MERRIVGDEALREISERNIVFVLGERLFGKVEMEVIELNGFSVLEGFQRFVLWLMYSVFVLISFW